MQIINVNNQIGSLKLPNVTDYDIISLDDKPFYGFNMQYDGAQLTFHPTETKFTFGSTFTSSFMVTASRENITDTSILVLRRVLLDKPVKLIGDTLINYEGTNEGITARFSFFVSFRTLALREKP